jgi:hypothetical protein
LWTVSIETLFKVARLKKEIDKLENHVIVCGHGRIGEMAVSELREGGDSINLEEISMDQYPNNTETLLDADCKLFVLELLSKLNHSIKCLSSHSIVY